MIYEDTNSITGDDLEFKWGQIYNMLQDKKILDASLDDLPIFEKKLWSGITRVSIRLELFPCSEVIGWILSKENAGDMILYNIEDKNFTSFTPAYITKSYNLSVSEFSMTDDWIIAWLLIILDAQKLWWLREIHSDKENRVNMRPPVCALHTKW